MIKILKTNKEIKMAWLNSRVTNIEHRNAISQELTDIIFKHVPSEHRVYDNYIIFNLDDATDYNIRELTSILTDIETILSDAFDYSKFKAYDLNGVDVSKIENVKYTIDRNNKKLMKFNEHLYTIDRIYLDSNDSDRTGSLFYVMDNIIYRANLGADNTLIISTVPCDCPLKDLTEIKDEEKILEFNSISALIDSL